MAVAGGPDRLEELLGSGVLEQEPAGSCVEGVEEVVVPVERREDDDVAQVLGHQLPGRLDAVHPGHLHVHQDDVGAGGACQLDRLQAVGRLPDDLHVLLDGEDHREAGAHHGVVVDEQHPEPGGHPAAPSG